jgi:hypothetical protein
MVYLPDPVVADSHLLAGLRRAAPSVLQRPSPSNDRFPEAAVEDRIRRLFHLDAANPLPLVCQEALRDYHAYLARSLSFPFQASVCEETEPLVLDSSVMAMGLCDPARTPLDSAVGILCEVISRNTVRLPLAVLKVSPCNSNCQMIDDYWHWFWNCR